MSTTTTPELEKSICVVGAGAAGLITAHVLLQDGFKNVHLITRDHTPGGVWASERVYPGLTINNVHGEFRFSSLPMPPSADPDGHLSGEDMRQYMQSFADRNLKNKITFDTEVLKISRQSRSTEEQNWCINVVNKLNGESRDIRCDRIVMCSGGCSRPNIPEAISPDAATRAGFKGPVFHSTSLRARMDELLESVNPLTAAEPGHAVVIGGGKSAQDVAAFLANQGRRVSIVFETTDAVLAAPIPFPDFIRKSRFLPIISPHCVLRTRLERFLHGTWLGGKIVRGIWDAIAFASYSALKVPRGSPLRNAHSTFWATRTNDEGIILPHRFHGLVAAGKIELIAPARASHFNENGRSIVLEDGRNVPADAVVLATGWKNSWDGIFDDLTVEEIGLNSYTPDQKVSAEVDAYIDTHWKSLNGSPQLTSTKLCSQRTAAIHRGIVPAKNIDKHDFAINGAIFTSNNGYTLEVGAHWIASYFRRDPFLSLPPSPADAIRKAEFHNAWLMRRFPGMHEWANSSYSGDLPFFNWPQAMDTLLEDMGLPIMRSGGNWLTWPFKVIDLKEIEHLAEEREAKRAAYDPTV